MLCITQYWSISLCLFYLCASFAKM